MTARPLYLQPTAPARVSLDAKVALRIHLAGQNGLRMPLAKISRVVSNHHTAWESTALMACLTHGIPVTFMDAHGQCQGWCFGTRRRETTLTALLRDALEAEDWERHFPCWLENQRRALASQALLLCGLNTQNLYLQNVRNVLCNLHRTRLGVPAGAALRTLEDLTRCDVAAALSDAIADPTLLAWYRPGLNLIETFSELVALHAHVVIHTTALLPPEKNMPAWATRHYEKHAPLFAQSIGALIGAFERFLREHWL